MPIIVAPKDTDILQPAIEQIRSEELYNLVNGTPALVVVAISNYLGESEAATYRWAPWANNFIQSIMQRENLQQGVFPYMILLNPRVIAGLSNDLRFSILIPVHSPENIDDLLLQQGIIPPDPRFKGKGVLIPDHQPLSSQTPTGLPGKALTNELSTVLLHELGHVWQYMLAMTDPLFQQIENYHEHLDDHLNNIIPLLPIFQGLQEKATAECNNPKTNLLYWMQLRMMRATLESWSAKVKNMVDNDNDLVAKFNAFQTLLEGTHDPIILRIEYHDMISYEHPFALKRNEPLRLRHGEEGDYKLRDDTLIDIQQFQKQHQIKTLEELSKEMGERLVQYNQSLLPLLAQIGIQITTLIQKAQEKHIF